jgi:hypothetical protein
MHMQTYLIKRQNIYHFRRRVPTNLIAILGKNEVVRSLRTSDFKTATRAAMVMADELERLFERIQTDTDLLTQKEEELDLKDSFREAAACQTSLQKTLWVVVQDRLAKLTELVFQLKNSAKLSTK